MYNTGCHPRSARQGWPPLRVSLQERGPDRRSVMGPETNRKQNNCQALHDPQPQPLSHKSNLARGRIERHVGTPVDQRCCGASQQQQQRWFGVCLPQNPRTCTSAYPPPPPPPHAHTHMYLDHRHVPADRSLASCGITALQYGTSPYTYAHVHPLIHQPIHPSTHPSTSLWQ